jgi:Flp pilus assembly protein TadD
MASSNLINGLGLALEQGGKYEEAVKAFDEYIKLQPRNDEVHFHRFAV